MTATNFTTVNFELIRQKSVLTMILLKRRRNKLLILRLESVLNQEKRSKESEVRDRGIIIGDIIREADLGHLMEKGIEEREENEREEGGGLIHLQKPRKERRGLRLQVVAVDQGHLLLPLINPQILKHLLRIKND